MENYLHKVVSFTARRRYHNQKFKSFHTDGRTGSKKRAAGQPGTREDGQEEASKGGEASRAATQKAGWCEATSTSTRQSVLYNALWGTHGL